MRAAIAFALLALAVAAGAAASSPLVIARVATGTAPCGAGAGFGALWVANDRSGTVVAVDPARSRVARTARVGRTACGIAIGAGSVWTIRYGAGELVRIDPRSLQIRRLPVGHEPFDVLFAAGSIWVTAHDDGVLVRIDPRRNRLAARIRLEPGIAGLAYAGRAVWVGSTGTSSKIFRVDPRTNRATAIDVGHKSPAWFGLGAGSLWAITHDGPGELGGALKVDPADGSTRAYVQVGGNPVEAALAPDGTVWVSGKAHNIVTRIDPATNRVVDVLQAGPGAYTVTRAFGDMWVTSYAGTDVWRFRAR